MTINGDPLHLNNERKYTWNSKLNNLRNGFQEKYTALNIMDWGAMNDINSNLEGTIEFSEFYCM